MTAALRIEQMFSPDAVDRPDDLDAETLAACRRRDPAALRRWVSRYERVVFAFLSRALGSGPHVEDLAQEVFLRAFQALPRFEPNGPARFSTWLLAIASHVAAEARRKGRHRLVSLEHAGPMADPLMPDALRHRRELAMAFEKAAAQIPDDQRDVFVLAEFHGLTMAEIGAVLGIPENTVKTRLFRARDKLRELLAPVWEA
jgi:RNA polymerase sigma-70 factor (ECF subfamily)